MLTTIRIAFRNTTRQKKRSFLLGGAIAFGMMVITLINGFTAGMVENVKENFSQLLGGHIFVSGSELTESERIVNRIRADDEVTAVLGDVTAEVKTLNRRSWVAATMIFGSKQTTQRVDGVDFAAEQGLLQKLKVLEGSLEGLAGSKSVILPAPVARKLGIQVGESLLVKLATVTGQQNVGEFQVVAVVEDQGVFGISTSYADLAYLNELIGLAPSEYQTLQIYLEKMETMDEVADQIYHGLAARAPVEPRLKPRMGFGGEEDEEDEEGGGLAGFFGGGVNRLKEGVEPWQGTKYAVTTVNDLMQPVTQLVGVLNTVGLVVFLILLTITMVGITNTFRMVLIERTREIGTMRAFGMQRPSVRNIFLLEALFIGLGGALCGTLLALAIMWGVSQITFSTVSALVFFLRNGRFSFSLTPGGVVVNLLILVVMSLLAAYFPARSAAKLDPAKALRTQN